MPSTAKPQWSHDSVEIPPHKTVPSKKVLTQSYTQAKEEHKSLPHLELFHFPKALRFREHDAVAKGPKFRKNRDVKCGGVTWRTRVYPQCNSAGRKQTKGGAQTRVPFKGTLWPYGHILTFNNLFFNFPSTVRAPCTAQYHSALYYVPVNSKIAHPPRAIPEHLTRV